MTSSCCRPSKAAEFEASDARSVMKQSIVGFHKDEQDHWVAKLDCGHNQHVRHIPPLMSRPWVESISGRNSMLGYELDCKKCDSAAPADNQ